MVLQRFLLLKQIFRPGFRAALMIVFAVLLFGCRENTNNLAEPQISSENQASPQLEWTLSETADDILAFGNPSGASADPSNRDNYLIRDDSAAFSYNNSRGTPNWAAWKTTADDLGKSIPRPEFAPDRRLPTGFRRIRPADYTGSGYDRGHLLPSADRFGRPDANERSFWMTNIVPQAGDLNQFPWRKLESYSRALVRRGLEVYTFAGVYGEMGRLRGRVTVPTNCWKVMLVLERDAAIIDSETRIIAVDMPNIDGIKDVGWREYRTTVRAIESKTGLDLFSSLPRELQEILENRIDVR